MRRNEIQLRVNFGDTDSAGIVFYPNYFKWFDAAAHQFFRSIGLPTRELRNKQNIVTPLLDVGCTFENPLFDEDVITIKTQVVEINRKTFKFKHEVFRGDTRTGHGFELRGWVMKSEGKLAAVPIPDEIRELLSTDADVDFKQINPWIMA